VDFRKSAQQLEKERNKARRHVASELLSSNVCPVKLELITGQRFLRYLLSLRKSSTNTRLSHSSYQAKRAALFHLFRSYNVRQPDDLQSNLKTAMKGVRRQVAVEKQNGDGRVQVGMEPMTFTLYKFLARKFLEMSGADGIFGHCFLVLSWNLACHSKNTCTIQLNHFRWVEDAFQILFCAPKK
jgi:hypothetical protein